MSAGRHAFVIGGGVAGIAAAFRLRERGFDVELLEAHRWLGGRAFSLPSSELRQRPDNGPHVMLGCYRAMRALLGRLGTTDGFARAPALELAFRDANGRASRLKLGRLPTPLALPLALLRLDAVSLGERMRAIAGLRSVLGRVASGVSVEDWIRRARQQGAARRYLWDPLCRAICNADPSDTAADLFLSTLRQAFRGRAASAALWLPERPWAELVGEPAHAKLVEAGVAVALGARVIAIESRGRVVERLVLADAGTRDVGPDDLVVTALPWHAFARLLPLATQAQELAGSPIVSIYFEADQELALPDDPLVVLVDGAPFHFLLRRPSAPKDAFALLAGGCRQLEGLSVPDIVAAAREQLARHFPELALRADARARVVKEARATVLLPPGSARLRPRAGPLPGWRNLALCGDWTATGLPSTLEGAVRSAECV